MPLKNIDSLKCKDSLKVGNKTYIFYNLQKAAKALGKDLSKLPFSLKIIFENLLRNEDGVTVTLEDIKFFANWSSKQNDAQEIAYRPARVLMQDFTGVPAVVDLAIMRDAMKEMGGDPRKINPQTPVDLVIDHSVQVDKYASTSSFQENVDKEIERNAERYKFLRWGQEAFDNFRVVPPGTGICHQVNLEYLAQVVWTKEENDEIIAYPDTLVGTDSHTTMVNGMAVLGWGVGGIEAEAAMLGQPISMLVPDVVGFKLSGSLKEGTTATDLVLTVTKMLRSKGVVGKFVEFYGPGIKNLQLADRATIANMAPEYGATCGFFPIDEETLNYMKLTSRENDRIDLVREYAKAQGMWADYSVEPTFTEEMSLDLGSVEPSLAGPKRPQDKVLLSAAKDSFIKELPTFSGNATDLKTEHVVKGKNFSFRNGDVAIAAITSCTNTSNPSVMMAAGLVAKKAVEKGITVKPWVKTSLAPGSKVVTEYLEASGLQIFLDKIGFNLVGYGCTTCIGNSGPLMAEIEETISKNDLLAVSVLSGNRNFEGRVHPLVKANYLASPPLVVAYAIAGTMNLDLSKDPIAKNDRGQDIFLKDIWPTNAEIADALKKFITPKMFKEKYADVFKGDASWQAIDAPKSLTYSWDFTSTYINKPPYFEKMSSRKDGISNIKNAKILALLGDSITTDHISPAGNISSSSPAAKFLESHGVSKADFNSYGARRGNHEIMVRGTFANIRIKNEIADGKEGGYTKLFGTDQIMSIYDASVEYAKKGDQLIVVAGKEYGTGSSRDWAAKGTLLLGVKAVIAESFERIHRSNLVGMGIVPLTFINGETRKSLNLNGTEVFDIEGLDDSNLKPGQNVKCTITRKDGSKKEISLLCRIDTANEIDYARKGGILQYVVSNLLK